MGRRKWFLIPVLLIAGALAVACAPVAEAPAPTPAPTPAPPTPTPVPFYAGKTIRFIVGFSAGGGYDTYTRAVARHIGKHIPGKPTTLVENKTGGGSRIAANSLFKEAKPDGLTVGNFNSALVLQRALGDESVLFTGKELEWIGAPSTGKPTCTIMGFSGLKTWQDVLASKREIKMGATSYGSTLGDLPTILNEVFGTNFKVVIGYEGTSKVRLAMAAREVDGACWGWESISVTGRAMLDAEGDDKLIPFLIHDPKPDPEVKDVPQIAKLIKDPDHLAMFKAWVGTYEFQRPLALPPKTPKDRVNILRKAFLDTMKDPEFLAEAKKAKLFLNPVSGEQIEKAVADIMGITPKAKEALQFLVVQ